MAVFYASYREAELLEAELSTRYRNLMRVAHEDNLRRVLQQDYDQVENIGVLRDFATTAAEARRFLTRRRALKTSLEDMMAAELDFMRALRRRRLYFIHKLLRAGCP